MNKSIRYKYSLLAIFTIIALVYLAPAMFTDVPELLAKITGKTGLNLGLDLRGGIHLVLEVDLPKAVDNQLAELRPDLEKALEEAGIVPEKIEGPAGGKITLRLPEGADTRVASEVLREVSPDLDVAPPTTSGGEVSYTLALRDEYVRDVKKRSIEQALEVIRNRVDLFGVAEPLIVRQGRNQIVVQLPGVKEPQRAIDLIGKTAQLEFKLVSTAGIDVGGLVDAAIRDKKLFRGARADRLTEVLSGDIPEGTEVLPLRSRDFQTGVTRTTYVLLEDPLLMSGAAVKTARLEFNPTTAEAFVTVEFTSAGTKIFDQITSANVQRQLAIVLDGVVRSAPTIQERISRGRAQITGSFTTEEAKDLAIVLRAGALPAPVKIVENLIVGPTLGRDSIRQGWVSGTIGGLLVIGFMIAYYRLSGTIANFALLLNLVYLLGALAMFGATLTLPGIAGIILGIGMAVDSNVLIFERMREEFGLGKTVRAGVNAGYDRAFWTIVDSHVTTLITAVVLFIFGTGPIRGFAVTLSLGVVFNLFTALVGTRVVYDHLHTKGFPKALRFGQFLKKTNFDFIALRRYALLASGLMVAIGVLAFAQIQRGAANLGIDFSGGALVQVKFEKPLPIDQVRQAMVSNNLGHVELQMMERENILIVRMKEGSEAGGGETASSIVKALKTSITDNPFTVQSETEIGPTIGDKLKADAIKAVIFSLIAIIVYLAFRFDLAFAVAAAIATFHDVLVVLGVYYLLDKEITLLVITALLTLAGYSLTDTVVVFDRIRENLRKMKRATLAEVINASVNEVLARTVVTTLTVAFVLVPLFLFGGVVLRDFSLALLLGVIVGTYSSVFVASPILYVWRGR
ncbi:MAG: protein translocase subunit SecD, partial [Myxococcota bacterium]